MDLKFLYKAPALLYKKTIIVGDTHFGMEYKLRRKGIFDNGFSVRLYEHLLSFIKEHKAERVIFLGDVKDEITSMDSITDQILSKLSLQCEVMIVKGNHDGDIEKSLDKKICVKPAEGMVFGNLGLMHGHSWPSEELLQCNYLVMGHQHPMVELTDAFGKVHRETVWVVAEPNPEAITKKYKKFNKKIKLILMPAFNPLVGKSVNTSENKHLGPLLNNNLFKLESALFYRLDGTPIGNVI